MVSINDYDPDQVVINQDAISQKARVLINELNNKVLERNELSRLVVLALLSSKNMFLIGKPGVGKTFIISKLKYVLKNEKVFEHLLMHDTKKEELFGYDRLDENGQLVHEIDRTVLDAAIIILDEMFKAKAELLNGLLGVSSQSKNFFLRQVGEIKLRLLCLFAMSNEFPTDEALDPFDDRLHFRYEVKRLENDENFKRLLTNDYDKTNDFSVDFTYDEIVQLKNEYSRVHIAPAILEFFVQLKNTIITNELNISDRKLDDAIDIFRACAYLNGREYIDYSDMFLLMHLGWRNFTERRKLQQIVMDTFFQKKEEVEKNLILVKEKYQMIRTYTTSHVDPFIEDKLLFDFESNEDILKYNTYVKFYIDVLKKLEEVKQELIVESSYYSFAVEVEEMIEENIFIINYKNSSFSDEHLEEYFEFNKEYTEVYNHYYSFANDKGIYKQIRNENE